MKPPPLSKKLNTLLVYATVLLITAAVIFTRIRLISVPLERDEGEYAYMGQLLLDGIPPYLHAYTMKLPGVAILYALAMGLFGQTPTGIHLGLLLVNLLTIALVYALGCRIFNSETAAVAAGYYALMSLSESVMGVFAHASHFVNLFLLAGLLLLLRAEEQNKLRLSFASGLCFGLAILMKQHAAIIIPFALYLQLRAATPARKLPHMATLLAGAVLPYALICCWMLAAGVFGRFWFWTVRYAAAYASERPITAIFNELIPQFSPIFLSQLPAWLLAAAGTCYLLLKKPPECKNKPLITGLLLISFIMTCPGFTFRPHYFVLMLPPIALLAALVTAKTALFASNRFSGLLPFMAFITTALYGVYAERDYLFTYTPTAASRKVYGANPFPEAIVIGDYLKQHSTANDRIAILGSEPEILFYAGRRSATGHIYMYGLMEKQKYAERMQAELIREIEAADPSYLVVVHNSASWLLRNDTPNNILAWGDNYISLRYDEVGIIDTYSNKPARYLWDAAASGNNPESEHFVSVYRRRW